MTKRTLIERMERRKAPKSWIIEIAKMYVTIDAKTEIIDEFASLIDVLAREKETLVTKLDVAHYQIVRAIGQLEDGPVTINEIDISWATMKSVIAQLKAYLGTTDHKPAA